MRFLEYYKVTDLRHSEALPKFLHPRRVSLLGLSASDSRRHWHQDRQRAVLLQDLREVLRPECVRGIDPGTAARHCVFCRALRSAVGTIPSSTTSCFPFSTDHYHSRHRRNQMEQSPFTTQHSRRFSWMAFMIVSAEMEHPVH